MTKGDATGGVVFVVDDDTSVRQATTRLLRAGGFTVMAWESAEKFLEEFREEEPGCLLLDLKMPGMSGLELQSALNERGVQLPIIFLSGHGSVPSSVRAMKGGAIEFLEKPVAGEALLACVRRALLLDAERRRDLADQGLVRARFETLTPREREIFPLIASGRSNKEVAQQLGISYRTVELHRARIMRKLHAHTLLELAAAVRLWTGEPGAFAKKPGSL